MRLFRCPVKRVVFGSTIFMVLLALAVALGTLVAQSTAVAADKPIKIATIHGHSGLVGESGRKYTVMYNIAAADINKAGGVNGCPLELTFYDDQSDPQQAVVMTRKAIADKNFVILGTCSSAECQVAFPVANQLQTPIISPGAAMPGLISKNRPWAFRLAPTDDKTVQAVINSFKKRFPQAKRFAIVVDMKDAFNRNYGTVVLPPKLKENGYEVEEEKITTVSGQIDFSAQVTKLKRLNPDAIGMAVMFSEAGSFAQEMKRQGISNIPVIGGTSLSNPQLIAGGGDAVEGWITGQSFWFQNPNPRYQDVLKRFLAESPKVAPQSPKPSYSEANCYELVEITAHIMKKAGITGETDLQKARTAIRDGWQNLKNYPALNGTVSIGADGEVEREMYIMAVKKGDWVRID